MAPAAAMATTDLGFEETELRLGLPGGGGEVVGEGRSSVVSSGKRGFAETIDLKLKLEPATPAAVLKAAEADEHQDGVAAAKEDAGCVAAAEEAAVGGKMKRSPSQSSVVTAAAVQADPAEKPRAPKYVRPSTLSFPFLPVCLASELISSGRIRACMLA